MSTEHPATPHDPPNSDAYIVVPQDRHDPHADVEVPPGWSRAEPEHVPRPTYWPAVAALGVTFIAWGVVTTWFISVVGLVLLAIALYGWIGELLHGA